MVGGQAIDLQAAGQAPGGRIALDADGLRAMHARKTGALMRAAAVTGAIMAGADERLASAVDRFATDVGLAFQIVDDILDVEGEARDLGKTIGKDAAGAKQTYPVALRPRPVAHARRRVSEPRAADTLRRAPDAGLARRHRGMGRDQEELMRGIRVLVDG